MALSLPVLLAEEFHDIAPPVNYSLIPPWMIGLAVFTVLTLLGLTVWWLVRRYRRSIPPPPLPRDRALAALASGAAEIEDTNPYQFSIRVSDILRGYVAEQFGVPLTRQTSYEFLEQVKRGSTFSEEEKTLLE